MPRLPAALALVAVFVTGLTLSSGVDAAGAKAGPEASRGPAPTTSSAPPAAPPKGAALLEGIDVSKHQGAIDWARVGGTDIAFVFARASAGTLTADETYATNRAGAKAQGLAVGAYHFANPDTAPNDAMNEANWFLQNATPASGDLRPVLDIEVTNGLSAAALTTWLQIWLARVTEVTGVRPMIYTSPNFWRTAVGDTQWFAQNGYTTLWTAHWTSKSKPSVPAANWGGNGWTFWQYSSTGTVPGIGAAVDLDRYNGTSLPGSLFIP